LPLPVPHLTAVHVDSPPVLDGRLDDAAWKQAPVSSTFFQKAPREGKDPTERTTVRVVYDDDAVYVGIDCPQTAPVTSRLTRRDREVEADWLSVSLGTRRDGKSAFVFEINAGGTLLDAVRANDTDFSIDWDENWEARADVRKDGWSAEFRIPFRILRYSTLPVQSWAFEVRRYVSVTQETDEWALVSRSAGGEVSHYGQLDGLLGLSARNPFELRPFILGRVRRQDATTLTVPTLGNTTQTSNLPAITDFTPSLGLDLKWHPTQDLTLDATINPDFAQVEADQLVLNLTSYETYYPEKRPFFLEGAELFNAAFPMVYTRRIGRVPPVPTLRPGESLLDVPQPTTIYGASKLSGTVAEGWTVATIQALTAPATVPVVQPNGTQATRVVEPLSAWNILRVRRELGDRAAIGIIATGVTRGESTGDWPVVPPGQAGLAQPAQAVCPTAMQAFHSTLLVRPGSRCFDDAYTGSVDGRWRSEDGTWTFLVQEAATTLQRGPPRYVPDGTTINSGDGGTGGGGYFGKEGGDHWVGNIQGGYADRKFDNNDVGYNQRANGVFVGGAVEYRTLTPFWNLLETHTRVEVQEGRNLSGLDLGSGVNLNTAGKLDNFWRYFLEAHFRSSRLDDREVGDGTALERAAVPVGSYVSLTTDPTDVISFTVSSGVDPIDHGALALNESAGLTLRALPQMDLDVLPTFTWNVGEPRYVTTGNLAGQYIFGHLDAKSLGAVVRATYTFTPRLTLQAYTQLFLASGHYSGFLEGNGDATGPRPVFHLSDLRPTLLSPGDGNPDFEQAALNVNVVVRWEWRLGSLLYLVYQRAQVPNVSLNPGETGTLDLGSVKRAPAADTFIAKLSYWWG
jgi:hypothetical protein